MKGPPLEPGGEDITWPDQLAPRGRKASSTRKIKSQTSNLKPHRTPQPGLAEYKRSAQTNTHTATPQPGEVGCSRNPSPSTHTHTAHPSQEWRGTSGARRQTRTPQHPS